MADAGVVVVLGGIHGGENERNRSEIRQPNHFAFGGPMMAVPGRHVCDSIKQITINDNYIIYMRTILY